MNVECRRNDEARIIVGRFCETPWRLTQTPYNLSFRLDSPFVIRISYCLHMPYHYLEDIGTADIAFEATGRDLAELFSDAADATMNVMIDNLDAIEPRETRHIELSSDDIEMLLFDFLQELIYFKDAARLLLRVRDVRIEERDEKYSLKAETAGEPLDAARHHQRADVKAVTLHDFSVEKENAGWKARVLLDI